MNPDQNFTSTKPDAPEPAVQATGPDKEDEANPNQNLKPTIVSDFQLAMLAATINPEACRTGNSRDALLGALALFEESTALCIELGAMNRKERVNWLGEIAFSERVSGMDGASRLLEAISRAANKPPPPLTLAKRDNDDDNLRSYLNEKLNLEGKNSGQEAWVNVRTVLVNFRWMFVDEANTHNRTNAARIQERDKRDEAEAQKQGISVVQLRDQGGHIFHDEEWWDGETKHRDFLKHRARRDAKGKVVRYEIEPGYADMLIAWKKGIRRCGGVKKLRPLTREEVFAKLPKLKIPKKVK